MVIYIPPFPSSSSSLYFPLYHVRCTLRTSVCAVLTTHCGGLNTYFSDGGAVGEVLGYGPLLEEARSWGWTLRSYNLTPLVLALCFPCVDEHESSFLLLLPRFPACCHVFPPGCVCPGMCTACVQR